MFKILCTTDFSKNSDFAIQYAIQISNAMKAKLHFITAFTEPRVTGSLKSLDERISEALEEDMDRMIQKLSPSIKTGIVPEKAVVQGNTVKVILEYAHKQDIQLIVIGTKGSTNLSSLFVGGIAQEFIRTSKIPILAIPNWTHSVLTGNTVLLCLDEKGIQNLKSIDALKTFKLLPDVKMDVFHMSVQNEKIDLAENTKLLAGMVRNIIEVEGDDAVAEIKYYVEHHDDIGIIAMVGRNHSFWHTLLFETNTTAELFATNVPLLILPE
ncbi:MAG: universal stress protein [Saprospiraceae bacterium]